MDFSEDITRTNTVEFLNGNTDFILQVKNAGIKSYYICLAWIIGDFLSRIIDFVGEHRKFRKHYGPHSKFLRILEHTFNYNKITKIFFFLFGIITAIRFLQDNKFIENALDYCLIIPIFIMFKVIGLNNSVLDVAKWIRLGFGCDYASGMASNYFHGYININLPSRNGIKGIRERISEYEDRENVEFAVKRLFIVIPDSLHSKPNFNSNRLEKAKSLEVVVENRAGVSRPFQNDVYRFKQKIHNKNYYISVEGATPLLSFHEALKSNVTSTTEMESLKREILLQFYKCIKKYCTENEPTKNEVEFVYYVDRTADGKDVDMGEVLIKHVKKMLDENIE